MASFRPALTAGIFLASLAVAAQAHADMVTGKVVGPDSKPVAGAKVFVSVFSGMPVPVLEMKTLISDAFGVFTVEVPPMPDPKEESPPVVRVVVTATGFGVAQTLLTRLPSDSNTIRLEKGVTIRGKVVDTAGKASAGVEIRLVYYLGGLTDKGRDFVWLGLGENLRELPDLRTTTDAKGTWQLAGIPATAIRAGVTFADSKYAQVMSEILVGDALIKPITARPAAVLVGKVVGKDGQPRPGVGVFASPENHSGGDASAVTAADGSYRMNGLSTGTLVIWVGRGSGKEAEEAATPLRQVVVTEGKETTASDLVMTPGGVVEGTVTDALTGKPVPGAQIVVPDVMAYSSATGGSISGSDGKFSLRLPPGKYKLTIPWAPKGYLAPEGTGGESNVEVDITESSTVPVSVAFRLARALTLSGVAQNADGKPVPGIEITVMEQGDVSKTTTDADGKWTFTNVKPGKVRIVALNDYEVLPGSDVTVAVKETAPVVLIVKPFKHVPLAGRVVTRGGTPVGGVTVQALTKRRIGDGSYYSNSQESRTDEQGRFTLSPVRPEDSEVELRFNKPGYKISSGGTLTRDGDRFVIADAVMNALDTGRTIKGRVTDSRGKPVPGAVVAATGVAIGPGETRTDALGRFTLPGVPEDSRLLAARGESFGAVTVSRKTAAVTVPLGAAKKADSSAAEDHTRAVTLVREIKKRYLDAKSRNEKVDDSAVSELPLLIAPLDFPLARELAKPDGTNPIDDQALAQMIREVAQRNPARINDWAVPALKDIGVTAVRTSAAYAIVLGLPEGPAKKALAKQVYEEMKLLTLDGSEFWVVARVTQLAILAQMLGLPEESKSWVDKAILAATEDKEKQYISVVAYESVNGGLPLLRYVLAKADSKQRGDLYWQILPGLTRINARAAQKVLGDMEADPELSTAVTKDDYYRSRALLELVRALAPQDSAAALQIAERLRGSNYSFSTAALAFSAQGQPNTTKAALIYEIAAGSRDAANNAKVLAKIASLASKNDPALGKKLFERANQVIQDRSGPPNADSYGYKAMVAKELSDIRPGESRLMLTVATGYLLTPEGQKEDSYALYRQNLALAWLPFSVDQALAIAARLPEKQEDSGYEVRNRTLQNIVVWLLTDPAKRNKLSLSGSDDGFEQPYY